MIAIVIVLAVFFTFVPVALWISALAAGVKISIFTLIGMRFVGLYQVVLLIHSLRLIKQGLMLQQINWKVII